jgi:G3E family GTPase
MNATPIPIIVLCGFLGSGKTTLLRRWRRGADMRDAAVIVHDLSELGVDVELVGGADATPEIGGMKARVFALHGVHAREKLGESIGHALETISRMEPRPPMVLVESTGAAHPWPLMAALTQHPAFQLRHFIVTVDALNLHRDFTDGTRMESPTPDPALDLAATLMVEQMRFANVILLTKTDVVPRESLARMLPALRRFNLQAATGLSSYAGLPLDQLHSVPPPDPAALSELAERRGLKAGPATVDTIGATIFTERRPFHPQRLHQLCQTGLGTGLYRTKGFLWLASRPGHVLLWQQAGSQLSLELHGLWKAELVHNREGKLLPEEVAALRQQLAGGSSMFGDRHHEITIIGLERERDSFTAGLRQCLCSDGEIAAWQKGVTFADPWPTKLRVLA